VSDANVLPERNKEEQDGERVIRRERYTGEVSRSFSLGS
jgi:HSP20 family protein